MATKKNPPPSPDNDDGPIATLPALIPPTSLVAPNAMSEAEKAFLAEAGDLPDEGPGKLPFIALNHGAEEFVMPSGETIPGEDGLYGFVIAHFTNRAWFRGAYNPKEKNAPDCKSMDCITPDANSPMKQADSCLACKWDQFGSAAQGKGKACREKLWLFIVNPSFGAMPLHILILPPTALGDFYGGRFATSTKSGYLDRLKMKCKAWQIIWTKITAFKKEGDTHCTVAFEAGEQASPAVAIELAKINRQFLSIIKASRSDTAPAAE